MKKIINIPDVLQSNDYGCGVYAVQSIMAYYNEDWWEDYLSKELDVNQDNGTQIKKIVKFFKDNDFKVYAGEFTIDKLKKAIDKNIPVILLIQAWNNNTIKDYWKNEEYGHYVICTGYTDKYVILEDPAIFGRGYLKFEELEKRWHGDGDDGKILKNFGIAVWGKKPFDFNKKIIHIESKNLISEQKQKGIVLDKDGRLYCGYCKSTRGFKQWKYRRGSHQNWYDKLTCVNCGSWEELWSYSEFHNGNKIKRQYINKLYTPNYKGKGIFDNKNYNNKKQIQEQQEDTEIKAIASVIKGKQFFALRKELENLYNKKDIRYIGSPYPIFLIKPKIKKYKNIAILNKKYTDFNPLKDIVVGDLVVGYI